MLIALVLSWTPSAADSHSIAEADADIQLSVNRTYVISAPGLSRVAVGSGNLVEVEVVEATDEIILIGLRPGLTDIHVWQDGRPLQSYTIGVLPSAEQTQSEVTAEQLWALIDGDHPDADLRITPAADSLNIHGRVANPEQFARIEAFAARFPSVFAYVSMPEFDDRDTIFIEAQFIEVTETGMRNIGIDWDDAIDGPVFAMASDYSTNDLFRAEFGGLEGPDQDAWPLDIGHNTFLGWGFRLDSIINLLVQDGHARVLAEPVLSAVSGESAEFHSGGEIPIPVRDEDGEITTDFREFGIRLEVEPRSDHRGRVRTRVAVEVSDINVAQSVRDIPALDSSRADTVMDAESGRSLVIAGLVSDDMAGTVRKVPLLGDLPILGEFFKSRRSDSERRELIIIVTPRIAGVESPINRSLLRRSGELLDHSEQWTRFHILD